MKAITRTIQAMFVAVLAAEVLVHGQADAKKVLSELRAALGGEDKIAAVKTIAVEGVSLRVAPDGETSTGADFEMAFELPGKFMKREMFANLSGQKLYRRTGFNGSDAIEETDTPPGMMGGGMHVMRVGGPMPGGTATPEAIAAQKARLLASSRRDFARFTVGMLGSSYSAFPVEFTYAGQAEASDGKADVLDVKGPDGFAAKLFVDSKTHLPLMLSWMDKEQVRVMMGPGGASTSRSAGGGNVQIMTSGGGGQRMTAEEVERMQKEMADRVKEAEAKARTVEYRIIYSDYKSFGGVKMPTKFQRMADGLPIEELTFEKVKLNEKISPSKFEVK
jgi:hypothetical protein